VLVLILLQRVLHAIGEPQQRQFAKRAEIAYAKIVRQRRVNLVGGIDVAVGHPPPQRFGRDVDELNLLGLANDAVGNCLLLGDAGDLFDHVIDRFQVLDVDRRNDIDAGLQQLLDVLPALFVLRPGSIRMSEFVDESHFGLSREDRL
jgi:hypothetical protein